MKDDSSLYGIGALAQRTGVSVRTIRFWCDSGVVPATTRSAAGHRLYDVRALAIVELVAALRKLGLGLRDIRAVLEERAKAARGRIHHGRLRQRQRPDAGPSHGAERARELATFTDSRVERYWQLVAMINGWGAFPSTTPAFRWLIDALNAHS